MMLLARMDDYGKAAWLGLTMLVFWIAWLLSVAKLDFPHFRLRRRESRRDV